ncbi:MAG: T9SS type A sorting domain-containing protein [Bacteroidetes bacterium]|nr:T9SS type A sorting domain-containing protein [Bacteroidota bacterium]
MRYLFLLIIIISIKLSAQTQFLPHINSEWHYKFGVGAAVYNEQVKYERDSTLGSETVKVVISTRRLSECNPVFSAATIFKQKNDSVFFRNIITNHQWQLLINYNALVGQNWSFSIKNMDNSYETYTVTIDSVNTSVINSILLKYYKVTYSKYNAFTSVLMNFPGTIYERFGDMLFLFHFTQKNASTCTGDLAYGIMCYQDSTFGLKQFTSLPCNYSNPTSINNVDTQINGFKIFPNPTNSILNLELNGSIGIEDCIIKIRNVIGQIVFEAKAKEQINIRELKPGIYFLQLYHKEKLIATEKIIKE